MTNKRPADFIKELQKIQLLWFSPEGDEFKGVIGNAMNDKAIPNLVEQYLKELIDDYIFELIANKPKEFDTQTFRNHLFRVKENLYK